MKIMQHSPHTGFPERVALSKVKAIQLPAGCHVVVMFKDGREEVFEAVSHNLYTVQEEK